MSRAVLHHHFWPIDKSCKHYKCDDLKTAPSSTICNIPASTLIYKHSGLITFRPRATFRTSKKMLRGPTVSYCSSSKIHRAVVAWLLSKLGCAKLTNQLAKSNKRELACADVDGNINLGMMASFERLTDTSKCSTNAQKYENVETVYRTLEETITRHVEMHQDRSQPRTRLHSKFCH
jgi:hypothetical protein